MQGAPVLDLISRADLAAVSSALKVNDQLGQSIEFECYCQAADGASVVVQWSVSKNVATGVRYWVGRDITERKRAEALLTGQAKANDASQAVIEFRMDGAIIAANPRFLALMEYRADEIVGQRHRIFVHPEYAASQEYRQFWQALERGEFQTGEFQRFKNNGDIVWVQATYAPIIGLDGKPEKVVEFATDITERKRTEARLAGHAKAIDASQAVIEFRMDGTIVTANQRYLSMMGYSEHELVDRHHRIFLRPEYAGSEEYRQFWLALERGEIQTGEFQRFAKNGDPVWMQATYAPIVGLDGKPEKVLKLTTDITKRVHTELQLKTLNDALSESLNVSRQRDADNSILSEITAFLQASVTEEEVLTLVSRYIDRISDDATAGLYIFEGGVEGERQVATGNAGDLDQFINRSDCWGLRRGTVHTRSSGASAPLCKHLSTNVPSEGSSICVPIFADGVLVAMLTGYWPYPERDEQQLAAHERTQAMLLTLGGRIGSAFEAIRLRSRLEQESIRDGLTGLYNRRYLDDALRRELQHARRLQLPVSAVMIDIDRFKALNDKHGHEMGDRALRAVAQTISGLVRQGDIVCRYGGEEFAIVFIGESQDVAAMKAEAIRAAVACLDVGGEPDKPIRVTLSAGVSEAGLDVLDGAALLRRADRALYQAKEDGRNLVHIYSADEGQNPTAPLEAVPASLRKLRSNRPRLLPAKS
jgi:diguanylate cyclase (GGDEF)-like protein/PAS domain S-box-containing protein